MNRITKKPEERKNEILQTAESLFIENGYNKTAISDIVKKIHVAQGTFYYYFKSKDDVIVAIFEQYTQKTARKMQSIIEKNDVDFEEKYLRIVDLQFSMVKKLKDLSSMIHSEENAGIHQRVILNTIKIYTPIYEKIIKMGMEENVFSTEYPHELAEYVLLIIYFMFNPGFFSLQEEEYKKKIDALCDIMQKALGCSSSNEKMISRLKEKCLYIYHQ